MYITLIGPLAVIPSCVIEHSDPSIPYMIEKPEELEGPVPAEAEAAGLDTAEEREPG